MGKNLLFGGGNQGSKGGGREEFLIAPKYRVFSEFLYTFVFAAIFLFEFYRRTIKGKKYAPDKVEKRKNP